MKEERTTAQIVKVATSKLVPRVSNARIHSKKQILKLRESIREFGFLSPAVIDGDFNIIVGAARIEAATAENLETIPCVMASHLSPAQLKAYALADNRLAEMSSWDMDVVSAELMTLETNGFDIDFTGFCVSDIVIPDIGLDKAPIDDPNNEVSPIVSLGDVWQLGRHRLCCGDCTDIEMVRRFRAGVEFDLYLTDPPYNVNYAGKTEDSLTIENDNMANDDFQALLNEAFKSASDGLKPGAAFYIWHPSKAEFAFAQACVAAQLGVRQILIWIKSTFVLGRQDYQWQHEPCLYGWKDGAAHYFGGDRRQSTLLKFDRPCASAEHPTMKPVKMFDYLVRNSTKRGGVVFDGFAGSGTTLIACESSGRTAYAMELDPHYCDVIINRWETLTGSVAVKIGGDENGGSKATD